MHNAPAVSFPLARSHFQGFFLALVWLCGVAVTLFGCALADPVGWRQYVALGLVFCLGASAAWAWRQSPVGVLQWDGQSWSLKSPSTSTTGIVSVHLDFQFFLLLSLRSDGGHLFWLWLDRPNASSQWDALRRAAFSRRVAESSTMADGHILPSRVEA